MFVTLHVYIEELGSVTRQAVNQTGGERVGDVYEDDRDLAAFSPRGVSFEFAGSSRIDRSRITSTD